MKDKAVLIRLKKEGKQTLGSFHLFRNEKEVYEAAALELPWRNNMKSVSCIPSGTYNVTKGNSPKYGIGTFHVKDVKNRTHILIHAGNYNVDTKGCILLGAKFADINRDGVRDISNSRPMIEALEKLTDEFTLTIIEL